MVAVLTASLQVKPSVKTCQSTKKPVNPENSVILSEKKQPVYQRDCFTAFAMTLFGIASFLNDVVWDCFVPPMTGDVQKLLTLTRF